MKVASTQRLCLAPRLSWARDPGFMETTRWHRRADGGREGGQTHSAINDVALGQEMRFYMLFADHIEDSIRFAAGLAELGRRERREAESLSASDGGGRKEKKPEAGLNKSHNAYVGLAVNTVYTG